MKSNGSLRTYRRFQHLFDCCEHNLELRVVSLLHLFDLLSELFVSNQHFSQSDEGTHDGNVSLYCPFAAENARQHRHASFGEGVRCSSLTSPSSTPNLLFPFSLFYAIRFT